MKRILLYILLTCFSMSAVAQPVNIRATGTGRPGGGPNAMITGQVVLSPDDPDGEELPGAGVTVIVIAEGKGKLDTLYTTVRENGRFFLPAPLRSDRPVNIRFTLVGYKDLSKTVILKPGPNPIIANLQPEKEQLKEAVIKETVAPLSIKGDTLLFNPNSVKVNRGDMAIDILEQMPGVEVTENGVTILNEQLANVYIDGALLFGQAPMRALKQLPAEEVVNMKSYQEYANKDPYHKTRMTESKERVLDIETRSKAKRVWNLESRAALGFDTDSVYHKLRYAVGAELGMNSESLQAGGSFMVNNISDPSLRMRANSFRRANGNSADVRSIAASASVTRRWMSKEAKNFELGSLHADYSYSNDATLNDSRTVTIYFPNEKYNSRETHSSSFSSNEEGTHEASLNANKSLRDGSVRFTVGGTLRNTQNISRSSNYNYQDELAPQGTSSGTVTDTRARSVNAAINVGKGFADKFWLGMSALGSISNSDAFKVKNDTTTSTITYQVLNIDTDKMNRKFAISPSFKYDISDIMSLRLAYNLSKVHNVTQQIAMDMADPLNPVQDMVNSQMLTHDDLTNSVNAGFDAFLAAINANFRVNLKYVWDLVGKEESIPVEDEYRHSFNHFAPSVSLTNDSMLNNWSISYAHGANTPALEQIRPRINNSNLYSVSSGNPNLKQNRVHQFSFKYSTILGKGRAMAREVDSGDFRNATNSFMGSRGRMQFRSSDSDMRLNTFSIEGGFNLNKDVIASKRVYYEKETYLPEYDYTMPAQSTFTSYENVTNGYNANFTVKDAASLKFLKSTLTSQVSFNWDDTPSFLDGVLIRTDNFRPTLGLNFSTGHSRNFRINIGTSASYVHSSNTAGSSKNYFTERIHVGTEVRNIFKHAFIGGNYNKLFTQGLDYGQTNDNILNMNMGAMFGRHNQYILTLTGSDIFNRNTGFSSTMQQDYIRNSWRHNFGRYVLLSFNYRFNSLRRSHGNGRGAGPSGRTGQPQGRPAGAGY